MNGWLKQKMKLTDEQKREIIERLYKVWTKEPEQRLGQLIFNKLFHCDGKEEHCDDWLFYREDFDLINELEK